MTKPAHDLIASVVTIAVGLWLLLVLADTSDTAAMLPRAVIWAMIGLALLMLGRSALRLRAGRSAETAFFVHRGRFAIATAWFLGYVALLEPLGFFTASALFFFGSALSLGARRPILVAVTVAGVLLAVWLIFDLLFERPLPSEFFQATAGPVHA